MVFVVLWGPRIPGPLVGFFGAAGAGSQPTGQFKKKHQKLGLHGLMLA